MASNSKTTDLYDQYQKINKKLEKVVWILENNVLTASERKKNEDLEVDLKGQIQQLAEKLKPIGIHRIERS